MPVDERSRHQLFRHLEEVLGAEDATTLIEHFPPVGWSDVATKRDLDALELRLDQRFVNVDQRIDHLSQVVDERFGHLARSMDERFGSMDERFEHQARSMDERFEHQARSIDERFDHQARSMDEQFSRVDERFGWMEERLGQGLEATKHELIGVFHRELNTQTKTMMFGMITIVLTMATLAFALARFT